MADRPLPPAPAPFLQQPRPSLAGLSKVLEPVPYLPDPRRNPLALAVAVCGTLTVAFMCVYCCNLGSSRRWRRRTRWTSSAAASSTSLNILVDQPLLERNSQTIRVVTEKYTYPEVRTFFHQHPKASLLPPKLPLIVLIHGLGGQLKQWQRVLQDFVEISHILAIDLPGCGNSAASPRDWDAYTTSSLASLVANVVVQNCEEDQRVVLIGHSMGCAIAATLATKGGLLEEKCAGLVAICPKAKMSEKDERQRDFAMWSPDVLMDLFRLADRRGGHQSRSVKRMVASNAPDDLRRAQLQFNRESKTPVVRRMIGGLRLPTESEWTSIPCPILLVAAADDKVTPGSEMEKIHSWIVGARLASKHSDSSSEDSGSHSSVGLNDSVSSAVSTHIVPKAGHAVLYERPHILDAQIAKFLEQHVDEKLSMSWQLSYLKEDKWLLKNFLKWSDTQSVSPRITGKPASNGRKLVKTPFRAMKTLRQDDLSGHNPADFSKRCPDVRDVIDISHDQHPYDPNQFQTGVRYHKHATVSKIPPTVEDVKGFIKLVDSIRAERGYDEDSVIACHCHYGFNRTGFMICTYLIERMGFTVGEALQAFAEARSPGIRHWHFKNELHLRYSTGVTKTET